MELVKDKGVKVEGVWRTAIIHGADFVLLNPDETPGMVVTFLTRGDGRSSGERAILAAEQFASLMQKLGVKRGSEMIGKACLILVVGTVVQKIEHLFAQNTVEE